LAGPGNGVALSIRGLTKAFGGLLAVRDLSFEVPEGGITGLIGPNGSGKTTVLNLVTGELTPDRGAVLLDGQDIAGWPAFRICRARIARTFQLVRVLPHMTVRENVMLGRMFGSRPAEPARAAAEAEALIDRVGLAGREDMRGTQLTYIDQKRVELARALALDPKLLLLDEPMAGMNAEEKEDMARFVVELHEERGTTIIMIEHDMGVVMELSDRVTVLNFGERIADGPPSEIRRNRDVQDAYLGEQHDLGADG
jgi:ABC-type branched-subunit amino acid transport system ATPase component